MKIVLTGGGTAGHVTPNIALIEKLCDNGYDIHYIGGRNSIEQSLIQSLDSKYNVKYYGISCGKLRRELNMKNFTDMFRVVKGVGDATKLLRQIKPDVVFSKGGFVTVPVVLASKLTNTKVVVHESDITPGLANKISLPIADEVCTSFEQTVQYIKSDKCVVTGTPIRSEILNGDAQKGIELCKFKKTLPVILVMGGSLGSKRINEVLREAIVKNNLNEYNVIHITGKDNIDSTITNDNYVQFEYVKEELAHLFKYSDIIVSRAGANAIFEILALQKPNVLIPLSKKISRGDQIDNAKEFASKGYSFVVDDDTITDTILVNAINETYKNRDMYIDNMKKSKQSDSVTMIIDIINEVARG